MYTYDIDGWYSGDNEQDKSAGRVTDIEPDTSNERAARWDDGWTYPYIDIISAPDIILPVV